MCYLAERLLYVNKEKMNELVLLCGQVTKIIVGLSRSVEKQLSA